jgi:putative ABC transport system substrate-binding protein
MRRREFIQLLGGTTAASLARPLAVSAQLDGHVRRVGVLHSGAVDDPHIQARNTAFVQALQQLGWTEGRNIQLDTRWGTADAERISKYVAELVALAPDVILATGSSTVGPLLQATRSIPIVFTLVLDPVGAGFVDNLARPGGNATGFMLYEYGIGGKFLELLKQIAPGVTRVAVLRDPGITAGIGQFAAIQTAAPSLGIEISPVNMHQAREIENSIPTFAHSANGGLVVTASPLAVLHRNLIIALAARYQLPAVYFEREFAVDGGLISYGPNFVEQYRFAAGYVDRILKGEKPAELPVQAPSKYELVINLKTAKALGLTIPASVLARADDVIE